MNTISHSLINPVAEKLEKTVAYTPIAVLALAGNSLIGIIVCKTPTLRKPVNPLIVNMVMSDLFIQYSCFLFDWRNCTLARALLVVPLVRPWASYTFSL